MPRTAHTLCRRGSSRLKATKSLVRSIMTSPEKLSFRRDYVGVFPKAPRRTYVQKKVGAPRPTPSQRVDRAYLTRGGRGNTERARLGSVQTHNGAKRARATPRHTARARGRSPPSRSAGRVRVLAFSSGPFVAVAQGRDLGRETENTTRHPGGFCGFAR